MATWHFFISASVIYTVSSLHNLIDTSPSCYTNNLCTDYATPGSILNIHPNSDERAQFLLRNIARLYPTQYIQSKYGKKLFGSFGTPTSFFNDPLCGIPVSYPLYYDQSLNELSRYHSWDVLQCPQPIGHNTCPNQCTLKFNDDCTFNGRISQFLPNINPNDIIEETWNGNIGLSDKEHCRMLYHPQYIHQGIGIMPGTTFVNTIYAKLGTITHIPSHPILHGLLTSFLR